VGLGSTTAVVPNLAPFGPGGMTRFWGSSEMWGIFVGALVSIVMAFGCYIIIRDRRREARSKAADMEFRSRLLAEGRLRDNSIASMATGMGTYISAGDGDDLGSVFVPRGR